MLSAGLRELHQGQRASMGICCCYCTWRSSSWAGGRADGDFFWKTVLKQGGKSAIPWLFSRTIFSKVVVLFTLGQRKDWDVLKQPFGFDQKGIKYQSLDIPAPPDCFSRPQMYMALIGLSLD